MIQTATNHKKCSDKISMCQWIYHKNTKNSWYRAHSVQVTRSQGIETKARTL